MAVLLPVLATGDVNPEVFAISGFKDELVEVGIPFEPVEPAIMVHGSWFMING